MSSCRELGTGQLGDVAIKRLQEGSLCWNVLYLDCLYVSTLVVVLY